MKKFLSLALALIMTMSLVTISTSAATFTDDDAIDYVEAVEVMAALDVIGGYADGSFAPSATLTRGAAAKIICNMILGPTVAGALNADAAPFPDVAANHVFAGYIAYCAKEGIINGYADGNFRADGTVTGDQFMKMLLGALGYDASIEGFTGGNWSVSVVKLATALGMADGNDEFVGTAAMTREEACLYAFNTLTTTLVEYDSKGGSITGTGLEVNFGASKASDVEDKDGKNSFYGYSKDETLEFCEKHFKNFALGGSATDAFGRPVQSWYIKADKIGTYVSTEKLVASYEGKVTKDMMYDLVGKDAFNKFCDKDADLYVGEDGDTVRITSGNIESYIEKNDTGKIAGNGAIVEVYELNSNGDTAVVIINTYVVKADADYNTKTEKLVLDTLDAKTVKTPLGTTPASGIPSYIENDDITVEDFEEDDYVLITVADGEIMSVQLAEVITGAVTSYSNKNTVTVDDTAYSYSQAIDTTTDKGSDTAYEVGEDASLVLDAQGNVIYVDDAIIASDRYVFISEYAPTGSLSTSGVNAAAYFADGTYEEISVKKVYDTKATDNKAEQYGKPSDLALAGTKLVDVTDITDADEMQYLGWFAYTTDSNGAYTLCRVEDKYLDSDVRDVKTATESTDDAKVVTNGKVEFTAGIKGNADTVFVIVNEDNDVYSYTGVSNVPDVKLGEANAVNVHALMKGSYASFVFVDASQTKTSIDGSTNAATNFMFALKQAAVGMDTKGDKIYTYEVLVDGEVEKVSTCDDFTLTPGMLYKGIKENAAGYITDATAIDATEDEFYYDAACEAAIAYAGNVLSWKGGDNFSFLFTDETELYLISTDKVYNEDFDAAYEVTEFSTAKSFYNAIDRNKMEDASVVAIADDDESESMVTIYVYMTDRKA